MDNLRKIRIIVAAFGILLIAAPALADEGWFERWKPCIDQGLIERADIDRATALFLEENLVGIEEIVREPAERGCAAAQIIISAFHAVGGGGLQYDTVAAYAWIEIAIKSGLPEVAEDRDLLASIMTPEEIAEAKRQARGWRPRD